MSYTFFFFPLIFPKPKFGIPIINVYPCTDIYNYFIIILYKVPYLPLTIRDAVKTVPQKWRRGKGYNTAADSNDAFWLEKKNE